MAFQDLGGQTLVRTQALAARSRARRRLGMRPSRIIQLSYLIIMPPHPRQNFYFSVEAINRHARKVHGLGVGQLRRLSGGDTAHHADGICRDFEKCGMVIGHVTPGDMRLFARRICRIGVGNSPTSALHAGTTPKRPTSPSIEPQQVKAPLLKTVNALASPRSWSRKLPQVVQRRRPLPRRPLRRRRRLSVHGGRGDGLVNAPYRPANTFALCGALCNQFGRYSTGGTP